MLRWNVTLHYYGTVLLVLYWMLRYAATSLYYWCYTRCYATLPRHCTAGATLDATLHCHVTALLVLHWMLRYTATLH